MPRVLWAGLLSMSLAACGGSTSPDDFADDRPATVQSLTTSLGRWQSASLRNYDYRLRQECFCASLGQGPLLVSVRAGVVTSAVFSDTGQALPASALAGVPTIDDLFQRLQEAVAMDAASIQVDYDPAFGYPTRIAIDFIALAIDDEITYRADQLQPTT